MALLVSPCSALDLLEACDDAGGGVMVRARSRFGRLARQVGEGVSIAVRTRGGVLALAAGLYPDAEDAEAWFAAGPALRPHLREAVRIARGELETVAAEAAPLTVRAFMAPHGVAGPRLAALFGFERGETTVTPIGPLASWTRRFP